MTHTFGKWLVVLALLVLPTSAYAQSPEQHRDVEASIRFERGVELFKAGNFAGALVEFEAAYQFSPNYAVLWNIAASQKNLFRYSEALVTLERYLKEGGDKVSKQKREAAEREQAAIRALMAEVMVSGTEGAILKVDNREVGKLPLTKPILLGPGAHKLQLRLEGYKDQEQEVSVVSGEKKSLEMKLELVPKVPDFSRLSVTTKPKGAEISVDDKKVGKAPWQGPLKPGGHRVKAILSGYLPAEQEVVLTPGQERPISFVLEKKVEPTPFFKRWYVWAGIGALAVAGGATYLVLSQEEPDVTITFPE